MTQAIRISHPSMLTFSKWTAIGTTEEDSGQILSWQSTPLDTPTLVSCTGSFDGLQAFNAISVDYHEDRPDFFPNTFRFEISNDGQVWEPILKESEFQSANSVNPSWHFPLTTARHIKFLFLIDKAADDGKYMAAFGNFRVMVSGVVSIAASSHLDRLWVKENLVDERPEYGWSSALRPRKQEEHVTFDLGSINRVVEFRLLSKNDPETFFPEVFRVSYSEDNIAWHHLLEENGFLAEPGTWYRWRIMPVNMRYLKVSIVEGARTREGKYISQIIEVELYANAELHAGERTSSEPIPYASELRAGIMRLAKNGEVSEGLGVQSNDLRLREATTVSKGIVELASDGEEEPGLAVQADDRRLKYASEDLPGIVRLARDGEVRAGHVVQSNDRRLRLATDRESGLVELATDGENRPGVVVQANDRRLRPATSDMPGIVRLARDGSDRPGEAVQGNDRRLREATTELKGILRFARSGETSPEAAVQGDDPRLRMSTTETPGIVELARDGEEREGLAVQAHDTRLKSATEKRAGIVELSSLGGSMSGKAVQANDPRLQDARPPLPHTHDYAPKEHSFDSHTGHIKLEGECGQPFDSLGAPPVNHSPIVGVNTGGGAGLTGKGKRDGVFGSGSVTGNIGYCTGRGIGVLGAARSGPGGAFTSESGYALVAGGKLPERALPSGDLALLACGLSHFTQTVYLASSESGHSSSIACYFLVEHSDIVVVGDVLVAGEKDEELQKARKRADTKVIGVVVENSSIVMRPPSGMVPDTASAQNFVSVSRPRNKHLVAIAGIVKVRAVADSAPIVPGDLLVTSIQSGHAEKMTDEDYRPGCVFAKSLTGLTKGEGTVLAVLT